MTRVNNILMVIELVVNLYKTTSFFFHSACIYRTATEFLDMKVGKELLKEICSLQKEIC